MIYNVRHLTTYRYASFVTFARCVLRLTPQSSDRQTVSQHSITVSPAPLQRIERLGPFGEQTLTVVVDTAHRVLSIDALTRVDVHAPPVERWSDSPGWEAVRSLALESSVLGAAGPAAFLYPTARTPIVPEITDYARSSFAVDRPIIEATAELMTRIGDDFTFDAESSDVRTSAKDAFHARRGVCQDFAHVMICALRGLGLPAAYVSGYLRTSPPKGRPRLAGADAMHAWVSVWCGEARGWVSFDPTNAVLVQDSHIVVATGRDYADVAPIDGILLSPGEQILKTEVDVIPEDDFGSERSRAVDGSSAA